MSVCQIEERDAGRPYPRTCPTCKLTGPCAKGLDRKAMAARIEALTADIKAVEASADYWHQESRIQYEAKQKALAERDALAEKLAMAVEVEPLDLLTVLKHAFLSGVVAARNIPSFEPTDGPTLWAAYEPYKPGPYTRIRTALAAIKEGGE